MTKQDEQAFQNPSYDKSLPARTRLTDFIGKYHIMLNGVKPHEVYERFEEDGGGLCCSEHNVEILDFVDQLLQTQREEIVREILECEESERGMPLKKIKNPEKVCLHPEHEPPQHLVMQPGTYEYSCPSCGKTQIIEVPQIY